jgi:hypothetical protein
MRKANIFFAAVLALTTTSAWSAPSDTDVAAIKAIYEARETDFASLKGQAVPGSDPVYYYGTISPVAGLPCIPSDTGGIYVRAKFIYMCYSGRLPENEQKALTPAKAKQVYEEIRASISAAMPGIKWFTFTVPPFFGVVTTGVEVAGMDENSLIFAIDTSTSTGDQTSDVMLEVADKPFKRSDMK